jgi:ubiquinone biosynthesis protein
MPVAAVARQIRNVKRYTEILDVLVRNGFADAVTNLGLGRLLERGYRLLPGTSTEPLEQISRPARMRRVMEELGPTFMKLGQMLSCRKDLIPAEWSDEFAKLQAEGPTLPFEAIRATLEEEFPGRVDTIFRTIDPEPIAAASMAQVHRARLADGTKVVLKILRPGTEERAKADLEILETIAELATTHLGNLGFDPNEVTREFARGLRREVDFTFEARSTDRLRVAFEDDPHVRFPKVYWQATSRRVLALEEFHGILLSRLRDGDLTQAERAEVVGHGATAIARQCLEIGLFHADPHPGNLFALRCDDGSMAAGFIDCGMTGRIEPGMMDLLARLVKAVVDGEVEEVIAVAGLIADVPPGKLEDRGLKADMRELVDAFDVTSFEQFDLPRLLDDFFQKLRGNEIRFPGELILLIKSLTTIQSVGASIDPTFDLIGYVRPWIEKVVRARYGITAMRRRAFRTIESYASLAEDLPREVRVLLGSVRQNNFAVNLQHRGLDRLTRTIEHASRNIGFALMVTGLTVSSAILVHASAARDGSGNLGTLGILGVAGFIVAGVLALAYAVTNRKWLSSTPRESE